MSINHAMPGSRSYTIDCEEQVVCDRKFAMGKLDKGSVDTENGNRTMVIRPCVLARKSAGVYTPVKLAQVATNAASSTTVELDSVAAFAVGDAINFSDTASLDEDRTITAINADTKNITVDSAVATDAGGTVTVKSQTAALAVPVGVLVDQIDLYDDVDRVAVDRQIPRILTRGVAYSTRLAGSVAAVKAATINSDAVRFADDLYYT